jgi:hypothetical protein
MITLEREVKFSFVRERKEDMGAAVGRGTRGEDQSGSPHADHRVFPGTGHGYDMASL